MSVPCYLGSASCLCCQEMWLVWVVLTKFILLLRVNGRGKRTQDGHLLNWSVQYGMKGKFTSLCCYVSVGTVFLCLGLSSAQQVGFFCERNKIRVPGTA